MNAKRFIIHSLADRIFVACFAIMLMVGASGLSSKLSTTAFAAEPVIKTESALQTRVRNVATKLRCPVCQGESIYDSHSDVAVEMKKLIAERLTAGASEAEILKYFQDRYGNFILMEPPTAGIHWVIWVFPIFLGLIGAVFLTQGLWKSARGDEADIATNTKTDVDSSNKDSTNDDSTHAIKELHL